ncbi:hypothetical protein PCE1_001044 [Barthelona sp. PCE]
MSNIPDVTGFQCFTTPNIKNIPHGIRALATCRFQPVMNEYVVKLLALFKSMFRTIMYPVYTLIGLLITPLVLRMLTIKEKDHIHVIPATSRHRIFLLNILFRIGLGIMFCAVLCGLFQFASPCQCVEDVSFFRPVLCGFPNMEIVSTVGFSLLMLPALGWTFVCATICAVIYQEVVLATSSIAQAIASAIFGLALAFYLIDTAAVIRFVDLALLLFFGFFSIFNEANDEQFVKYSYIWYFFVSLTWIIFALLFVLLTVIFTRSPHEALKVFLTKTVNNSENDKKKVFGSLNEVVRKRREPKKRNSVFDSTMQQLLQLIVFIALFIGLAIIDSMFE